MCIPIGLLHSFEERIEFVGIDRRGVTAVQQPGPKLGPHLVAVVTADLVCVLTGPTGDILSRSQVRRGVHVEPLARTRAPVGQMRPPLDVPPVGGGGREEARSPTAVVETVRLPL